MKNNKNSLIHILIYVLLTTLPSIYLHAQTKDSTKQVEAKFLAITVYDGEATLTFTTEDGNPIKFIHDYTNDKNLEYTFTDENGQEANNQLKGKFFNITYSNIIRININTEEEESINKIYSISLMEGNENRVTYDVLSTNKLREELGKSVSDTTRILNYITNGADINVSNEGWTALMIASQYNNNKLARLLIEKGANVNATLKQGKSILMIAASNNSPNVTTLLLQNGADVNQADKEGYTALMYAANKGYDNICQILINNNAQVNTKNSKGHSALTVAVGANSLKVVKLLLNKGADINSQCNDGWTPMMYALGIAKQKSSTQTMQFLIEKGANLNIQTNEGYTILDYADNKSMVRSGATACNCPNIVTLLKTHGAKHRGEL